MVSTHAPQFRSELSFYSEIIPSIIIISFKRLPKKRFMPFLVSSVNGSSIRNLYPGVGSPYRYVSILFPLSSLQLLHPSYLSTCSRTHLFCRFRISSCVFLKRRNVASCVTGLHGKNCCTLDSCLLSAESSLLPNSTQRKDIFNVPRVVAQILLCTVSSLDHAGTCSEASETWPSSLVLQIPLSVAAPYPWLHRPLSEL